MPKILFIAMIESIHTARWLNEIKDMGWDIHLFPSNERRIHPDINNVTIHGFNFLPKITNKTLKFFGAYPITLTSIFYNINYILEHFLYKTKNYRANKLANVIKTIKPDIIHTLEMQHAGYVTLQAKKIIGKNFPPWIYTPWGSDLYFFGDLPIHKEKIKQVLSFCNYYIPKSDRDIKLAKKFGFNGEILTKLPGNGGIDTLRCKSFWQPGKCSDRKIIMVKGYQGQFNRALIALDAIESCADALKNYSIIVYSAFAQDVKNKVNLLTKKTNLSITILEQQSHDDILKLYGKSHMSISASISDGVPNSLLESMAMGSFPIESNNGCANEWITHEQTGCIISPESPESIVKAIKFALKNDDIINQSAEINFQIVNKTIDKSIINPKITSLYIDIFKKEKIL